MFSAETSLIVPSRLSYPPAHTVGMSDDSKQGYTLKKTFVRQLRRTALPIIPIYINMAGPIRRKRASEYLLRILTNHRRKSKQRSIAESNKKNAAAKRQDSATDDQRRWPIRALDNFLIGLHDIHYSVFTSGLHFRSVFRDANQPFLNSLVMIMTDGDENLIGKELFASLKTPIELYCSDPSVNYWYKCTLL